MVFTPGFLSLATASTTIWSQALPYSSRGANENKIEISVQSYCHKKTLPIQKETWRYLAESLRTFRLQPRLQRKSPCEPVRKKKALGPLKKSEEDTKNGMQVKEDWPRHHSEYQISALPTRIYAKELKKWRKGDVCAAWGGWELTSPNAWRRVEPRPKYLALFIFF